MSMGARWVMMMSFSGIGLVASMFDGNVASKSKILHTGTNFDNTYEDNYEISICYVSSKY